MIMLRRREQGCSSCLRGSYLRSGPRRGRRRSGCLRGPYLRRGRVETLIVLDKGCFELAVVAQIANLDARSIQGFPNPGGGNFEDGRYFFLWSGELKFYVRHGEGCSPIRILFIIGVWHRYHVEEVGFLETTGD